MSDVLEYFVTDDTHRTTLIENVDKLRESGALVDCTLEVEGKYLKVHKVILAASSIFFLKLFNDCRNKGPVFVMKDVAFAELKATIDFIYRGEAVIPQDQLEKFLKTAKALQIKGLFETGTFNLSMEKNNNVPQQNHSASQSNRQLENSSPKQQELDLYRAPNVVDNLHEEFIPSSASKGKSCRKRSKHRDLEKKVSKKRICESDSINATEQKIIPALEVAPCINSTSQSEKKIIQIKKEFVDIPNDNVDNCVLKDNLSETKDFSNREDTKNGVLRQRKVGKSSNTYCEKATRQRSAILASNVITNCETSHEIKSETQVQPESSCAHYVKRNRNKTVVSNKKVSKKSSLLKHRYLKQNGDYSCLQCGRTYKLKSSLLSHLYYVCGESKVKCDICQKVLKQKRLLVPHMMIHDQDRKKYPCPQCGKTYTATSSLNRHLTYICGKEPQFQCDICNKKVKLKDLLVVHMRKHNTQKEKQILDHNVEKPTKQFVP